MNIQSQIVESQNLKANKLKPFKSSECAHKLLFKKKNGLQNYSNTSVYLCMKYVLPQQDLH